MFGSGRNKYPGVVATHDIKHREAIIAVPFDQLISFKRISKELTDLMKGCPKLFSEKESSDSE